MPTSASPLDIALLRRAILSRTACQLEASGRASVVLILHPGLDDIELLLIRRAKREGDPWSGQIGLPGGHRQKEDADDQQTALRETEEEIGLNLAQAGEFLGVLDDIRASARGHTLDLVLTPFVYQVGASPRFVASVEVAEVLWVSLSALANGKHFICHPVQIESRIATLPGWSVGNYIVWGLTYRIISGLLRRAIEETKHLPSIR